MSLDRRKIQILEAIIDDYIKTAEPVGSRTIMKKYDIGISSATIRNEMVDLEELGLIIQPHTSAGRVPSDKGYRLYVDQLIKMTKPGKPILKQIDELMTRSYLNFDDFIKDLSQLVSYLTRYIAVVSKPMLDNCFIKYIQLIPVEHNIILMITITNNDMVKNNLLRVNKSISKETLDKISYILNVNFCNLTLKEINLDIINVVKENLGDYKQIVDPILDVISGIINEANKTEYYASGINNILSFPEFNDIVTAKELIKLLESGNLLEKIASDDPKEEKLTIKIGAENGLEEAKDCSIITYKYEVDTNKEGVIALIGPRRMDYGSTLSILAAITNIMEKKKEEHNDT